MHILYLCNEYPPHRHGGIGAFVQLMARQLVQLGHRVSVLGLYQVKEPNRENDLGVNVYRIPIRADTFPGTFINHHELLRSIWGVHADSPIDLIEGNELSFGLLPGKLPARKIIRMHGGHYFFSVTLEQPRRFGASLVEKISFFRADHFCAVSRFAAETTRKLIGLGEKHIEVLPNPVDTNLFRPFHDIPENDGLIVFTGGLREKKGVRQLLQAMPQVIREYPSAHLWIYGNDTKDRRTGQSFLEALKKELPPELNSKIEFRGYIPHTDLPQINAQASLLIYPSWMETQGIVVIEGMASEKPVIASQAGPGPELIDDGQNGLLCDPHSPDSIASQILRLLGNRTLRKELSLNARAKAQQSFSIEVMLKKNLDFYESRLSVR